MQQYEIMRDVMNTIYKGFTPKEHTFTITETASCETSNGDMVEDLEIDFDLVGEFGGYCWQNNTQTGQVFETALEAYSDAVEHVKKLADRRSDMMQSEYQHYRLGGGRP